MTTASRLGESLSMSTDENFVVAGAPYTNSAGFRRKHYGSRDAGLVKVYLVGVRRHSSTDYLSTVTSTN